MFWILIIMASLNGQQQATGQLALDELAQACAEEGGALWGRSLCGPMLIVDPSSRAVVANVADSNRALLRDGDFFVGVLPADIGLANTALEWSGTRWAMVLLPLPQEEADRRRLMLHESWHRLQPELGLGARAADNGHLEDSSARIWLRMEWRALAAALAGAGDQRLDALADALLFRSQRHRLFAGSQPQEAALELNEGLAEYTGIRAAYQNQSAAVAVAALREGELKKSLTRSFAYFSGPAYGLILDDLLPQWRRQLTSESDLGELARRALNRRPQPELEEDRLAAKASVYGFEEVRAEEQHLGAERSQRHAAFRQCLVEAPGLVLPLGKEIKLQFNPNQVIGLQPHGTVYIGLSLRDSWGKIEADSAALITSDFHSLAVAGPYRSEGMSMLGDGWKLDLAPGWKVFKRQDQPDTLGRKTSGGDS